MTLPTAPVGTTHGSLEYRMKGNLDEASLECTGRAKIVPAKADSDEHCWHWTLQSKSCRGAPEVDWLHLDGPTGELCRKGTAWTQMAPLPGRGACFVRMPEVTGERLLGFTLSCTWECRDARDACAGAAEYIFSQQ